MSTKSTDSEKLILKPCNGIITRISNVVLNFIQVFIILSLVNLTIVTNVQGPRKTNAIVHLCYTKALKNTMGLVPPHALKYSHFPFRDILAIRTQKFSKHQSICNNKSSRIRLPLHRSNIPQSIPHIFRFFQLRDRRCRQASRSSSNLPPLPHQSLTRPCLAMNAPC